MTRITAIDCHKDFMGNDLAEGDMVAVIETPYSGAAVSLELAQVINFTEKKIRIRLISKDRSWKHEGLKSSHQVCKLNVENMKETPVEWIKATLPLNR